MRTDAIVKNQRGVALLLVLSSLVLISIMIVGFLLNARQDFTTSSYYASGVNTRELSDMASGIVIAQISQATADPTLAWISQPGLIRTFNTTGQTAAYKLFSSDVLLGDGTYNPGDPGTLQQEVPSNWYTLPDEFVDLNQPVTVNANPVYPIADPRAETGQNGNGTDIGVQGFSFNATAVVDATGTKSNNPLPMPVRWIYVLADGSLATWAQVQAANAQPPVGRIAFWTDDETCKVNLNTASDGVFYDSPVTNTTQDHNLGLYEPIAQEYPRYPGHPSATSLAAVLPTLRNQSNLVTRSQEAAAITPRIGWGGSEGATIQAWWTHNLGVVDSDRLYASVDEAAFGKDASGDWFDGTQRNPAPNPGGATTPLITQDTLAKTHFFLTTDSRSPELNVFNRPRITLWPFNQELLTDSPTHPLLTPEDRLIRFCSEIGLNKRKLYFQRSNAWDPLNDYTNIQENQDLYGYLQWLTEQPVPGNPTRTGAPSATLETKYTKLGRDQIVTEMFDYLRSLVNTSNFAYQPVNGPTYSFPQNHNTLLTGFNDITPMLINAGNGLTKGLGSGSIALNGVILQFYNAGEADDATDPTNYLIRKVQLVVLLDWWLTNNNLNSSMPRFQVKMAGGSFSLGATTDINPAPPVIQVRLDGASAWQSSVALGVPNSGGNINVYCNPHTEFEAGSRTDIMGGSLGLSYGLRYPANGTEQVDFLDDLATVTLPKLLDNTQSQNYKYYPFVSTMIDVRIPKTSGTAPSKVVADEAASPTPILANFVGGTMTISVYPALVNSTKTANTFAVANLQAPAAANCLQTITLNVPACDLPLPRMGLSTSNMVASNATPVPVGLPYSSLTDYSDPINPTTAGRLSFLTGEPSDIMLLVPTGTGSNVGGGPHSGLDNAVMDTFRGMDLATGANTSLGDLRIAALQTAIPSSWYVSDPLYTSSSTYHGMSYFPTYMGANNLPEQLQVRTGSGPGASPTNTLTTLLTGTTLMLNGLAYWNDTAESLRSGSRLLNGAIKSDGVTPGDFSNGYGIRGDGGLVKGPDIGSIAEATGLTPYYSGAMTRTGTTDNASTAGNGYHTNFMGLLYSPWKQMPSAVMFGTLPSRALDPNAPGGWETLLFDPVPNGTQAKHRGWSQLPRDHYWLDYFDMPVVEPYAITENLATNGKINLNEQIAPFNYITRTTGLYALLHNMQLMAVPNSDVATQNYKTSNTKLANATATTYRAPINVDGTVSLIANRWTAANDPYVTASEICEIPMVPSGLATGSTLANIETFWSTHQLTGDDKREAPYNHLYPRVTTKSNTYRLHFWVQSLKSTTVNGTAVRTVTGQFRGSSTIERYLDLSAADYGVAGGGGVNVTQEFPALAGTYQSVNGTTESYYKFRVINFKQFAP